MPGSGKENCVKMIYYVSANAERNGDGSKCRPFQTITEAAMLAVWYSQARESQNVAVDVTPVKQIKKPVGGKPGMVIYHEYRTVYVTPDPKLPEKLKA